MMEENNMVCFTEFWFKKVEISSIHVNKFHEYSPFEQLNQIGQEGLSNNAGAFRVETGEVPAEVF